MEIIGKIFIAIIKFIVFIILSVFVVPGMIIMATMHKKWESLAKEVFQIDV